MKHSVTMRILAILLLIALAAGCMTGCSGAIEAYLEEVKINMNFDRVYVILEGDTMILTTEAAPFRPTVRFIWNKEWRKDITKVVIRDEMKPKNIEMWFRNMTSLETIEGLEKIDTSHMFFMTHLFLNCENLKNLEGITQWDTSRVEQMQRMFDGCKSLTALDLSSWDVGNVETMDKMFANSGLTEVLGIENWNVEVLESASGLFQNCGSLENVGDLNQWKDCDKLDADHAFDGCTSLPGQRPYWAE